MEAEIRKPFQLCSIEVEIGGKNVLRLGFLVWFWSGNENELLQDEKEKMRDLGIWRGCIERKRERQR